MPRHKILLVEDIDWNRELIIQMLEDDYTIVEAVDGEQALRLARVEHPDLILMDMSLPVIDGWEATRRLKSDPETRAIPVVAVTAHAMVGDRERAFAAGCDDFVTKPVDEAELVRVVTTHVRRVRQEPAAPKRVLVVDDEPSNRDLLEQQLTDAGYVVELAAGGEEALKALARNVPALVILDVMMPGIDGIEVCRRIRADARYRDVLVVFLSAKDAVDAKILGLESGANDYIAKPYEPEELLGRMRAMLRMQEVIDDLKSSRKELLDLVIRDALTDIYNRRYFFHRLEEEFHRSRREADRPLSCMIFDLDHFKQVNDNFGHVVGDRVLKEVAGLLRSHARRYDVIARYGGEEFSMLLPGTPLSHAEAIGERVRAVVAEHEFCAVDHRIRLTVSCGVAQLDPRVAHEPMKLVRCADEALYRAKGAGRNRVNRFAEIDGSRASG